MASDISANEFEDWLTPKQAVALLDSVFGTDSQSYISKHTLLECLRGRMVRACAAFSSKDGDNQIERNEIGADEWLHVGENTIFWTSGHLTYKVHLRGSNRHTAIRHHDVRFEPESVRIIGAPASKQAIAPRTDLEPAQKGPRVSDAHLKAWYALYCSVYPGDTLESHAVKSAQGMFPDKTVSRDRVRELRGPQKRGRKATDA